MSRSRPAPRTNSTRSLFALPFALAVAVLVCQPLAAAPPSKAAPVAQPPLAQWRAQIRHALFIPDTLPAPAPHTYSTFSPTPGITAERVSYATLYNMRVPAIVYRSSQVHGRVPALIVVNGHAGDKTSTYASYTGILYARAGAVVITYDPLGEDERNSTRASATRAHDAVIDEPQMPQRVGGQMIADILQAVSYALSRPDVDPARIAVLGFSMGSFHSALAGALDTRVHALVLSGGGNLSGPGDYWDSSPKVMCQSGPYKSLAFLPDRGADLYALNQQRGPTLILNGTADPLIVKPNTFEPFFDDLRNRTAAVSGTRAGLFETMWFEGAGHRPNFITRRGAIWLQEQLHFPNWTAASLQSMPEIRIGQWAAQTGAPVGTGPAAELGEAGLIALDAHVPNIPRPDLQAIPDAEWQQHKADFIYESWVTRARAASKATPNP